MHLRLCHLFHTRLCPSEIFHISESHDVTVKWSTGSGGTRSILYTAAGNIIEPLYVWKPSFNRAVQRHSYISWAALSWDVIVHETILVITTYQELCHFNCNFLHCLQVKSHHFINTLSATLFMANTILIYLIAF